MNEFRVAIIGAGNMGKEHARAFSMLEGVHVAGLASRTRARAEAMAAELAVPLVADSVAELSVSAVAKAAFACPWAVLIEKPAGYDLEDAEDIARAAAGRQQPVMVGFNRRFYSSTRAIRDDLDTRPEETRFVHVQDQQSYAEARRYNHPEQVVERFMYANSIHLIDLIPVFGRGEVARVQRITPWRGGETVIMMAYVEFTSGDTALYEGVWQGPGPWACSVSTVGKRWTMQPLEQAAYQNAGERARHSVEVAEEDRKCKPGLLLQARAAVAKVRGASSSIATLGDSLGTMRLIHHIFGV